jgi:hypothetical protein
MTTSRNTYETMQDQQKHIALTSVKNVKKQHVGQYFTLLLFGVFVILLLMALWMGTEAFRAINAMQSTTDNARLALNSLQNRVKAFDEADAFSTAEGPEGPSIVFTYKLEAGDYETRLYLYQGALVQELAFSDDPYIPMTATKIVDTNTFSFEYEDGLLTVTTDQGTMNVALRSEVGAADSAAAGAGEGASARATASAGEGDKVIDAAGAGAAEGAEGGTTSEL